MGFPPRTDQPCPAHPICKVKLGYQKLKLLIPGHISGSFCEFSFSVSHLPLAPAPSVPLAAVISPASPRLRAGAAGYHQTGTIRDVAQVPHFGLAAFEAGSKTWKSS